MDMKNFCVYYVFDQSYTVPAGVSLFSLYENNTDLDNLDTWLFVENVEESDLKKLQSIGEKFGRKITFVDTAVVYDRIRSKYDMEVARKLCEHIYFVRLFVGEMLSEQYDYALHIDADTIVLGRIDSVFDTAESFPVSAGIDIKTAREKKLLGYSRKEAYYNCGMLAFNLDLWNAKQCESRIYEYFTQFTGRDLPHDQDTVNHVLRGEIGTLPMKYNAFSLYPLINYGRICFSMGKGNRFYSKEEYTQAQKNPTILHLINVIEGRPWAEENTNPHTELWESYARKAGWDTWEMQGADRSRSVRIRKSALKVGGPWALVFVSNLFDMRNVRRIKQQLEQDRGNR